MQEQRKRKIKTPAPKADKNDRLKNTLLVTVLLLNVVIGGLAVYFAMGGSVEIAGLNPVDYIQQLTSDDDEHTLQLEPFTINLNATPEHPQQYMQVALSLSTIGEDNLDTLEQSIPQIRDTVIHELSQKNGGDIQATTDNQLTLKDDLLNRLNQQLSNEIINEVYVTDLLVQ